MQKRTFIEAVGATALILGLPGVSSGAAPFPARDLKIVIPFAPGGATDVVFRVISERAEKALGRAIVPMNIGGAGGSKGSINVKGAKPDGYTLLGGHEFLITTRYGGLVNFGLEAFDPVCTLTVTPLTVNCGVNLPYKTYQDFVAFVKAHPGKAVVTMTPASVGYVFWYAAAKAAGFDLSKDLRTVVINGSGPQTKSVLGGHADIYAADLPTAGEYAKDGRLLFLAVTSEERLPQIPDCPTMKELGYDVTLGVTRAVFVPRGTPADVVERIAQAYREACEDPEVMKRIADMGTQMMYLDQKATGEYFAAQEAVYKEALLAKQ